LRWSFHDVVVFQQVLADVVVAGLDPLLRGLDGAVQPGVGDGLALGHAEAAHDGVQAVAGEDAQQVVLAGQEEFRHAGVALTAGAAAQLVVDAAALVALGAQNEQTAGGQRDLLLLGDLGLELGFLGGLVLGGDRNGHVALFLAPLLETDLQVAAQLDVGAAPAMLVAMVMAPGRPACTMMSASRACCLALSTWCGSFSAVSSWAMISEFSIEEVPTSTGWPRSWHSRMSVIAAAYFSLVVL